MCCSPRLNLVSYSGIILALPGIIETHSKDVDAYPGIMKA
jgi:hypothetical protein